MAISVDGTKARVLSDIVQNPTAAVVDGDLVKIMSWYDNEWGYPARFVSGAAGARHCLVVICTGWCVASITSRHRLLSGSTKFRVDTTRRMGT